MDDVNDAGRIKYVNHLEVSTIGGLSPDSPLVIPDILGPWRSLLLNDPFSFFATNPVLGNMIQIPHIPSEHTGHT